MGELLIWLYGALAIGSGVSAPGMARLAIRRWGEVPHRALPRDREWWLTFSWALHALSACTYFGYRALDAVLLRKEPSLPSVPMALFVLGLVLLVSQAGRVWAHGVAWTSASWRWLVALEFCWGVFCLVMEALQP